MRNNRFIILVLSGILLFCVAIFTGCTGDVKNDVGNIRFSDEYEVSRGLALREELFIPTDDLYWAYTAEKIDGLYTKGESKIVSSFSAGITAPDACADGKYCVLRPVKQGPAAGLNGSSTGPFATGDWKFTIYGYKSCAVEGGKLIFKDLIYKGVPIGDGITRVVAGTEADVFFTLSVHSSFTLPNGTLAFGTVKITVPESKHFYGLLTGTFYEDGTTRVPNTVVKARVFDGTTLIAQSVTTVTTDCPAGTSVALEPFVPVSEDSCRLTAGVHNIIIAVEYQDKYTKERSEATGTPAEPSYTYTGDDATYYETGFAKVGDLHVYAITFEDGKRYVLFQDLNDLTPASETPGKIRPLVPYEAKMLRDGSTTEYNYYGTFSEAVSAYDDDTRPIVLLSDVEAGSVTTSSVTVDPNSYALTNLTVSSTSVVNLKPGNSAERIYTFTNGTMDLFSAGDSAVTVNTTGGNLTVNTTDNVIHNGSVANLTITECSAAGYHLQADVTGELKIAKGFLDICGSVTIEKLNVTATSSGSVTLKATHVNTVKNIFNGSTELTNGIVTGSNGDSSGAFRLITLDGNGYNVNGKTFQTCYIYGIEGMYLTLPLYNPSSARTTYTNLLRPIFESSASFTKWTDASSTTVTYTNGQKITVGSVNLVLKRTS